MAAAGIHVFDLRTFDAAIFCQFIDSKDRTVILRGNLQRISKMIGMSVGEQTASTESSSGEIPEFGFPDKKGQ